MKRLGYQLLASLSLAASVAAQTSMPACPLDRVVFQEIDGRRSLRVTGYAVRMSFLCPPGHPIAQDQVFTRPQPDADDCRGFGETFYRVMVDGADIVIVSTVAAAAPCCFEHSFVPADVPRQPEWLPPTDYPIITDDRPEGFFWLMENAPWPADTGPLRETRWRPASCAS